MTTKYDVGDGCRLSASFTDPDGAAIDPTDVTAKVLHPDEASTVDTYVYGLDEELVKDSTGHYHLDVTLDLAGEWWYRFAGTGDCQAAEEAKLTVEESMFNG